MSLITDTYSRQIVGHVLHPKLEAVGCIEALKMALENRRRVFFYINTSF
ncbi:hypothetical protein ACNQF7_14870 [Flavobacterium sp. RSP29]